MMTAVPPVAFARADPGVGDDGVEPAVLGHHRFERRFHRIEIGDVGGDPGSSLAQTGDRLIHCGLRQVGDDDGGSVDQEFLRDAEPDALRRARDQRDLPGHARIIRVLK